LVWCLASFVSGDLCRNGCQGSSHCGRRSTGAVGRHRFAGHPGQKSDGTGKRGLPVPLFSAAYAAENGGAPCPVRETPMIRRFARRWSAQGKLEQMHDWLRVLRRSANGGRAGPRRRRSMRSPRVSPRRAVTTVRTPARGSRGASAIPPSTQIASLFCQNAGWSSAPTPAWNERARRLVMHHDRLDSVSEARGWLAEARTRAQRATT
jgi:hypothetical protein